MAKEERSGSKERAVKNAAQVRETRNQRDSLTRQIIPSPSSQPRSHDRRLESWHKRIISILILNNISNWVPYVSHSDIPPHRGFALLIYYRNHFSVWLLQIACRVSINCTRRLSLTARLQDGAVKPRQTNSNSSYQIYRWVAGEGRSEKWGVR